MVEKPHEVDPLNPATWVKPVRITRGEEMGALTMAVEYTIPMTPNSLLVALMQLPQDVPRTNPTFLRTMLSKSNVARDGRHKGGFIIEMCWPRVDIMSLPDDDTDIGYREEEPESHRHPRFRGLTR